MKIAVIGPVAPFISGISQHTSALARELSSRSGCEVKVWSFKRQYPAALFPGDKQKGDDLAPADTRFTIDTLNPLSWHATAREVADFEPDIAILPAWTFFVAPALGSVARFLSRSGIEVAGIVHNAEDHEAAGWKNRLLAWQIGQCDRAITHNEPLAQSVRRQKPSMPVSVSPHPLYDTFPDPNGELPRRAALELLYFGIVRPYKGIDVLIDALGKTSRTDIHLTIAGEFWGGTQPFERQIEDLGLSDRIEIKPGFASDADVAEFFDRCDCLVTPYRSATGSGVIAIAQHYRKPVIASDVSGLREAVVHGQTGWLVPSENPQALATLIDQDVTASAIAQLGPALARQRAELSWEKFADAVIGKLAH